jgi:parvulin-like peptidyl-prolyl isomerase
MYKRALLHASLLALGTGFLLACKQSAPALTEDVLATVNDTPITEADIELASRRGGGHRPRATPPDKMQVLEDIIEQELIYQRAIELGLDADPAYREQLRGLEAQVNAFKRRKLAELFHQREVAAKATVSDDEVGAYIRQHAAQVGTEINVWQILRRDENQIEHVRAELAQGAPFEEVAAKQFGTLPPTGRKPWELGYLRWEQVPASWRNIVYDLDEGETSDVIRGLNNRFWIVKLIDKREIPSLDLETVKPRIEKLLTNEKIQRLSDETGRALRYNAHIVYRGWAITKD